MPSDKPNHSSTNTSNGGFNFSTSFKTHLENVANKSSATSNNNNMDDTFKTGDFSSKHFTRKSSVFSIPEAIHSESPSTRRVEGGFREKTSNYNTNTVNSTHSLIHSPADGDDLDKFEGSQSYKSTRAIFNAGNSISGLSSLISSSVKRDPVHQPKPQRSFLSTNTTIHHTSNTNDNTTGNSNALPPATIPLTLDPIPSSFAGSNNPITRALSPMRSHSPNPSHHRPASANVPEIDVDNPDKLTLDVVGRHLVHPDADSIHTASNNNVNDDEFNSLQLQSGDISRELYNWQRTATASNQNRRRSMSFSGTSMVSGSSSMAEPAFQVHDIRIPGGFRRSFLVQKASRQQLVNGNKHILKKPTFFTRNFIEFLTLYGHFAGEELRDEEDESEEEEEEGEEDVIVDEESPLLQPTDHHPHHKTSTTKAVLLLLKAFIGTGVLFLPKGFQNAGYGFSLLSLSLFSGLSYFCFMLLINTRVQIGAGSYGDLGGSLYGPQMRFAILTSIVLSQIGFAAAYIVFTGTNLKAFVEAVMGYDNIGIEWFILLQLFIFIPFSLTRKIQKLSGTALVADLFILLGLIYVYYYCSFEILSKGVSNTMKPFNEDWSVFIGTAIFTYEGIGLLIPIQESMQKPLKFPMLLFWVMFASTLVFISAGAVGYMAFGAETKTVILLNFPQDSLLVPWAQFIYSMAILLSTPLQLFPAIRILENGIFAYKSGKGNLSIKWTKNGFRIVLVVLTSLLAWIGASNLDRFVAIIGSFACIPLIYLYPPLLHLKTLRQEDSLKRLVDMVVIVFGVVLMCYTTYQTLSGF